MTEPAFDRTHLDVDLTDSALYANGFPHDVFAALRRYAPVKWQSFPEAFKGDHDEGFWVLSKHEDVQAASHNPDLFSAFDGPQLSHQPGMAGTMLVSMDGRDHRRQRRLISAGFTPRMVGKLEFQIRQWAESIVDRALECGECDFVSEIAYKLPMNVIADIVGIPVQDRDALFSLANDMLQGDAPERGISQEDYVGIQVEIFEYAQKLGLEKRLNPQDDVWTILSTVEIETDDGEHTGLSEIELDMFFVLLLIAGSETTRNAVSLGLLALLDHPAQLEHLRRVPGAVPLAVEEILRWSSPVSCFARRATRDTRIQGVAIAKGERVTMWYPSANRDSDVFADPFRFDTARSPNPHLAFGGGGVHFCLGASPPFVIYQHHRPPLCRHAPCSSEVGSQLQVDSVFTAEPQRGCINLRRFYLASVLELRSSRQPSSSCSVHRTVRRSQNDDHKAALGVHRITPGVIVYRRGAESAIIAGWGQPQDQWRTRQGYPSAT